MTELADEQGNGLRDTIESAYASSTVSPDIDSAVSGAVEQRDRENRDKGRDLDRFASEAKAADSIRDAARKAVNETKLKAAQGATEPVQGATVAAGAPKDWDAGAKAAWDQIPQEARLAIHRAEATRQEAFEPRLRAHEEIRQAFEPVRDVLRQAGIQDEVQGVKKLLEWEGALRNPATRAQAFHALAQQYQFDLGGSYSAPDPVERELSTFSTGKEHFETVRETMGRMLERDGTRYVTASGAVNLDALYRDAVAAKGLSASRAAAPSRNGAVRNANAPRGTGKSVRQSILDQVQQLRRA